MGIVLELYELKNLCKDMAELGAANYAKMVFPAKDLISPNASAIMFVKGRIKFYRPDGTQGDSPGCGSVLIAFGDENAKILEYSNIPGKYIKLNN